MGIVAVIALSPISMHTSYAQENANQFFVLKQVTIEGNSAVSNRTIKSLYKKRLKKSVSRKWVELLERRVTAHYLSEGYLLSFAKISVVSADDGIINIKIIEGFVDGVQVEGDSKPIAGNIKKISAFVKKSRPLHMPTLERYLRVMEEIPNVNVSTNLRPSGDSKTALTLYVSAQTVPSKNWSLSVSSNDRVPEAYDSDALQKVQISVRSQSNYSIALSQEDSGEKKGYVSEQVSLGKGFASGLSVNISNSKQETRTLTGQIKVFEPYSTASITSLNFNKPIVKKSDKNINLSAGLRKVDKKSYILDRLDTITRLDIANIGFSNSRSLQAGSFSYYATLSKALGDKPTDLTAEEEYFLLRYDATGDASTVNFGVSYIHSWRNRLGFSASLNGQRASDSLYDDMRCGYGGAGIGRGYLSTIMTGDECMTASIELTKTGLSKWRAVQFFYFADGGQVKQEGELLRNEAKDQTATSRGIGIRGSIAKRLNFSVEYGEPVSQDFEYKDKDETNTFANIALVF